MQLADLPRDDFDDIELPRFPFEAPDARKDWTELQRQVAFRKLMRVAAPTLLVYARPQAGKRNPAQARAEGIISGPFDLEVVGQGMRADIELKGWRKKGKYFEAGKLSPGQIWWGNRMQAMGHPVAMFFDPVSAAEWLATLGFPVRLASLR